MHSHDIWVTLNGEIYNYLEVRATLERRGVRFRTASDTEVLLEGYREFGWAVLDMLEGMWSFAIYDQSTGRLSLCRDRFGEKPLYFAETSGGFAFASEISALSILMGTDLKPNREHVQRFLVNGYKSLFKGDDNFFHGVSEVSAGTVVHINDDGGIEHERYWSPTLDIIEEMDFKTAVEGAREHLCRSVEMRLRSDVPLAFSLSGGVDSVALASIARNVLGVDVNGFTILNSDPRYEERELVQHVVAELGVNHTGIELDTSNFLRRLQSIIAHRGAPLLTITYYVQWMLMQEVARAGYKVVVGGTGADEIFTGYYDHHLLFIAALDPAHRPGAVDAWTTHVKPYVRNPFLRQADRFVKDPSFRDHIYLDADRFASLLRSHEAEDFSEVAYHPSPLRNRMLNELFHESVPVITHEEDLNAMTFSIENRSPYLDRGLMEFVSSVPSRLLVRDGRAKAVLREAVRDIAPARVLDNPRKVGFNAPIRDLINLESAHERNLILADSPIYELVRHEVIEELLQTRDLLNSESKFLFSFLSCKAFLEEFE